MKTKYITFILIAILTGCSSRSPKYLDNHSVQELISKLKSNSVVERRDAAFTFSRLSSESALPDTALPDLRNSIKDRDSIVSIFSAHALSANNECSNELLLIYESAIKNRNSWFRVQACSGVRRNTCMLHMSNKILLLGLQDNETSVIWESAQSLQKYSTIDDLNILNAIVDNISSQASAISPILQCDLLSALQNSSNRYANHCHDRIANITVHKDSEEKYFETKKILFSKKQ